MGHLPNHKKRASYDRFPEILNLQNGINRWKTWNSQGFKVNPLKIGNLKVAEIISFKQLLKDENYVKIGDCGHE